MNDPSSHSMSGDEPLAIQNFRIPDGMPCEGPIRILVVCADTHICEATVRSLAADGDAGWEPDAAHDVTTTRSRMLLESWDLIIIRLEGGALDFRQVMRTNHAASHWRQTPILATIPPHSPLFIDLRSLGACDVLSAPFTTSTLVKAVRKGLANAASTSSPGPWWDAPESDASDLEDPLV